MSRIGALALATVLILGSVSTAVEAAHHGGRGGGGGGGSHAARSSGGGGHSFRSGGGSFRSGGGFRAGRVFSGHRGGYSRGYRYGHRGYYRSYSYSGCRRWQRVWTDYGWVMRRVNVCYYPRHRHHRWIYRLLRGL